jgi:hypothetical protein
MNLDETLLDLIGGIYDCTLNPDAWNALLPRIGAFVGGSAGGLFVHDSSRRSGSVAYEFGTDPDYRRLYLDKYLTNWRIMPRQHTLRAGHGACSTRGE